MINTHKEVFEQLAKSANSVISSTITCKLAELARADEVNPEQMETIVNECVCKNLATDFAVKALRVVLFSLQREEQEIESEARRA